MILFTLKNLIIMILNPAQQIAACTAAGRDQQSE
jgi:hypothetical protein